MLGLRHRPKTIELSCPACGHSQEEPRRVVSSICRSCGGHFRVVRGIAVANPGPRISGIAEVRPPWERFRPLEPDEVAERPRTDGWLASADRGDEASALSASEDESPALSAGKFFGFREETTLSEETAPLIGRSSQSRETLARGSIAALIGEQQTFVAAEPEKMPPDYAPLGAKRREEAPSGFPVRCFRCHHIQQVSRFAKSTQCERCSAYIGFADYEIKSPRSATLRTRGDVVVKRRGALLPSSEIACHHFTANGPVDASLDCTGTVLFRRSGTARGRLRCERLVVEKGCEVAFPDGAACRDAEISGRLLGDLECTGKARIGRSGVVEGKLRAAVVDLREGGQVSGEIFRSGSSPADNATDSADAAGAA